VRVALDTNVLVAAVATRGLCADVVNLIMAEHELILGEAVQTELKRVLRKKMRVPAVVIDEYDSLLRRESRVVSKAKAFVVAIRDKSDIPVLSEAIAGNAEILITGDRDLLDIAEQLPLQILTPRAWWEQLRRDGRPLR
jgi:putative PIN family toxin of toxin-antitoxin system